MFCSRRTTWLLVFLGLFFAVTLTFAVETTTEEYIYPDDNDECEEDSGQSHYTKVVRRAIIMEQKLRFRLVLGRLAIMKKKLGKIMSNF